LTTRNQEATAVLKIHGMSKSGRADELRRAVVGLEGVFLVDINYTLDNVTVNYDADKITLAEVRRKLDPRAFSRGSKRRAATGPKSKRSVGIPRSRPKISGRSSRAEG
jgi:copper chaperone CopZ